MRRATIIGSVVAGLVAIGVIFSGPIEDQVRCRLIGVSDMAHDSFDLRVSRNDVPGLVDYVSEFSERNGLIFRQVSYPSGITDKGFRRTVVGACNRIMEVHIDNTFDEEDFSVLIFQNDRYADQRFDELHNPFVAGLRTRFELTR